MSSFSRSFHCRLCWRITLVVFALILGIEAVLLVPSARNFVAGEHQRLAHKAQVLVGSALAEAHARGVDMNRTLQVLVGHYGLRAIAVYGASGNLIASAGGNFPNITILRAASDMAVPVSTDSTGNVLVASWRSDHVPGAQVVVRVDAAEVGGNLRAYLFRVSGLIVIIVLVVTAGTMWIMDVLVLRPLLTLRDSAEKASVATDQLLSFRLTSRRRDEIGELTAVYNAMLEQVAESRSRDREMAEERARFLTRHDPATGLPNRTALEEFLDGQIQVRREVMLFYLNILRLDVLDSLYRGQIRDRTINELAGELGRALAPADFLGRVAPDRLAVAKIGRCEPLQAEALARKLLNVAERPFYAAAGEEVSLEASLGIALSDANVTSGRDLMAQADMALAHTDEDKLCKYAFYSRGLSDAARKRQILLRDLVRAIAQNELFVVLQPKVSLQPDCRYGLAGAEVLLRWRYPTRGLVNPGVFIPVAEFGDMIEKLGEYVLRAATAYIRGWVDRYGWSPRLAVNVSAKEFYQPGLMVRIQQALRDRGVHADLLEVEITETVAMHDIERTAVVLEALRQTGIKIAIDDFGTGYSSLSYLRRLPVDSIKIDKSFVDDIGRSADAEAICGTILRLGQTLGMRVVAEGVETEAQVEFLCRRKCDEAQGYLFGKPVTAEDFENKWLISGPRGWTGNKAIMAGDAASK